MHITHKMNMHNCQLCKKEWLGRCFGKKYGKDVSVDNEPCKCYEFDGSKERLKEIENNMKWRLYRMEYFSFRIKCREHRKLFDGELKVCQIPSMIYVLDKSVKR